MEISNAKFVDASETVIKATLDGNTVFIPVTEGNRHYKKIVVDNIEIEVAP